MGREGGWAMVLLLGTLLSMGPALPAQELLPAPPAHRDDEGEYDALLELLDELPREEEIDTLRDYLERYPNSVHRYEIEQRLTELEGADGPLPQRDTLATASVPRIREPFSFTPVGVTRRFESRCSLGGPLWAELLLGYEQPINSRWAVGGRAGFSEWTKLLETGGRYRVLTTPRNGGLLEVSLSARAELGLDSRLQIEPRVGYGGMFGPVQVQTYLGARFRVTGGFFSRVEAGVAAGLSLNDDWWIGLESAGHFNFVYAERPDLSVPEPSPYLVSFFAVTGGIRRTFASNMAVDLFVSVPAWYRYQRLYGGMAGLSFWYRFD